MAVFSHREDILENLIGVIQNGGSIYRKTAKQNDMRICVAGKKMPLARYLYCLYHGKTYEELNHHVCHKEKRMDEMVENCCHEDLYEGGALIHYDEDESYISVQINNYTYKDVFDAVPCLFEIMTDKGVYLRYNSYGRLMCNIRNEVMCTVADIAYLAYYDSEFSLDNYIEKIRHHKKVKQDNNLTIEHLNGDYHQHYKHNIALVDKGLNTRKYDKASRIKEPYFFVIVTDDGKFKMLVGKADENLKMDAKRFITENFEHVVALLEIFAEVTPEAFDKQEARRNNLWTFRDRKFSANVAKAPECQFASIEALLEGRNNV